MKNVGGLPDLNTKILHTLEFDKVQKAVAQHTRTAGGYEQAQQLMPSDSYEEVTKKLAETSDSLKIQRLRGGIPVPQLENIQPHMKRIAIGANLNGLELAQISRVLQTVSELTRFFDDLQENEIELSELYQWADCLTNLPELTRSLKQAIDEDGRVTDEASVELKQLRGQIRRSEQQIREQLDGLIRGKNAKYLSDTIITMRNDRFVIPVKQEYRNIFGGVVHDQSTSGQTLFIEPKQIVDLNNRLRQQQIAERAEIERILSELSASLVPHQKEILENAAIIAHFDLLQAKAQYAKEIKGTIPTVNKEHVIEFIQARHPLIDADKVVANDLTLGKEYKTVVITGPNTGGKTITLKTLGLLQLMGQAGLPLSVAEESQMGLFTEIFADIGDEQSIEQNLSTFSSHMTNIVRIVDKVDDQSLVLFDELGAGTDPQEGAALAISILDAVAAKGAYVMATTHYPELKAYGYNRPETINASMEFDVESLSPTYHLLIGVPGRSNAFDISKRLGLDAQIIQNAKQLINDDSQDLNEMISDLENRRKMAEMEYLEVRHYVDEATKLYQDLKDGYEYFYQERENELKKAKKEANQIVENAQEEAEQIIKEIRRMQLEGGQTEKVKEHELIAAKTKLSDLKQEENHLAKNKVLQKAKKQKQLKPGDEVIVETYGQRGTLLNKVGDHAWQVQLGILKMQVDEADMTPVSPAKETSVKQRVVNVTGGNQSHVANQLDLRGKRYEEALHEVDQYLDAAILAGYPQVTIVHGKGTGALRQGITDYLKQHRSVKSYNFAPANQGGNGATIVVFK